MEALLTITAVCGLLSTGFVLGDYLTRRHTELELRAERDKLKDTLASIQATHNQQVIATQEMADRMAGIEFSVRGGKVGGR